MPVPSERLHCDLIAGADLARELDALFVNASTAHPTARHQP